MHFADVHYCYTVDKKESYIQVFYSINGKILLETSSRCEKFLLKLNRITNKTSELSIDEESQSGMSNFEEFDDLIQKKDDNKGGRGHNKDQKRANPYIYLVWILYWQLDVEVYYFVLFIKVCDVTMEKKDKLKFLVK